MLVDSTWDFIQNIFMVAGGLGLFLYGMKMMSDGLENLAGHRMRIILERATSNCFVGILIGALITVVIQSSTATTVMTVGFVNAGMISLVQAISLSMGANIGTTLSALIISFRFDAIAPLFIFAGFLLYLIPKKKTLKGVGFILLSIGILFFGLSAMSDPLGEFAKDPGFQAMLTAFRNPVLAILFGFLFTAVVQSSTAASGIIVTMYLSGIDLNFTTAAYIVLGINAGTCVTALIASLAASRESKRAALANLFTRIIGCVIFGTLIFLFPGILRWFQSTWADGARQIAMFHMLFNIATTLVLVPFVNQFAALQYKILPKKPSETAIAKRLLYISQKNVQTPETAFAQAHSELCRMGNLALDSLRLALDAFFTSDAEKAETVLKLESTIDYLNKQITLFLVRIQSTGSTADMEKIGIMLYAAADMERLGDHSENIAECVLLEEHRIKSMPPSTMAQLHALSDAVLEAVALALEIFDHNRSRIPEAIELERQINVLYRECLEADIERLNSEGFDPRSGVMLAGLLNDLERCADHAINIANCYLARRSDK
ncbi:MAG: Na/Pi cotransporter family protein [Clostridiales bacterium]|nr:Na/Pi cotransporter family protein [Clostridiales bacterium]